MESGTAILAVRFMRWSARGKKANCRARPVPSIVEGMALRHMGKMPMPQQNDFSYTFLGIAKINARR
ncbi:MAG: hypothetical protein JXN61_16350 [Sedimentisphaerales bacterium]|nr:hypothetical protein [Sedimentisphaerales bacterium]